MGQTIAKNNLKIFFPNLDGLRTIAFLFVYFQHAFQNTYNLIHVNSKFLDRFINDIVTGGTGVSIFFVLSGFLITYLILSEIRLKGNLNVRYFYVRRILRIWPLYYLIIVFVIILYPYLKHLLGIDSDLANRPIYYFTFISNFDVIHIQKFFPGHDTMSGNITWSIAVEEQFYLLWPLLFYFIPKKYHVWIFYCIITISAIFRFIHRNDLVISYYHSLSVCGDLAIGGLFAYYSIYSKGFKNKIQNISKVSIIIIYLTGISCLLYSDVFLNLILYPLFARLISTAFFAFIILEQNFCNNSFFKFSKSRFLTFWGKYTYGLYLIHPLSLLILDISLRKMNIPYTNNIILSFTVALTGLLLTLFLSYISYEFYEKRFLLLKNKFSFIKSSKA